MRRLAQQDVAVLLLRVGMLRIGRHIDQSAELAAGRTAGNAFNIGIAAAVGHVVVRAQFDDAVFFTAGKEHPAQHVLGIAAVEIDRIGDVGARKLHGRQAAQAACGLLHRNLRESFGEEHLRYFETGVLRRDDFQRRHVGRGMHHHDASRRARGGLDAHAPGIDRRIRPVLRPFDPEHFALRRAEITDYIEYRRHSL